VSDSTIIWFLVGAVLVYGLRQQRPTRRLNVPRHTLRVELPHGSAGPVHGFCTCCTWRTYNSPSQQCLRAEWRTHIEMVPSQTW
jgi:hypothetical protein